MKFLCVIIVFLSYICMSQCFIPAKVMSTVIGRLDGAFGDSLGKVSESIVHDEILKRGVIQSVAKYLSEHPIPSSNVDLSKMSTYYDLRRLYFDYYGKGLCNDDIPLVELLEDEMEPAVASIDFSSETKDLPYAHFDAEAFVEANERVIYFKTQISYELSTKKYKDARKKTGEILHTIQDFYSHSNWVEMGYTNTLQTKIGTTAFKDEPMVTVNDTDLCSHDDDKCTLVKEECSFFVNIFAGLINAVGLGGSFVKCPLEYYDCEGNLLMLSKLVSGYYTGQELPGGVPYNKPDQLGKCSHGGILDGSSFIEAEGGINKDSGYTVFSPHAKLHTAAAALAINHSQLFLDDIRSEIGDSEFEIFLSIMADQKDVEKAGLTSCTASEIKLNSFIISLFILISVIFFYI